MDEQQAAQPGSLALQEQMIALIRAFGLHKPDMTPCGQPVSVAEAHALMELSRAEPRSQNELAGRLGLEKSTVSRLVSILEQRAWISRARSDRDARVVELRLTAEGERISAAIAGARATKFQRVLQAIPQEQRSSVLEALNILVEAMRESYT